MSEIENLNMKRRLLVVDNILAIEDLLDRESQRLERLQKLKGRDRLYIDDKVSPEELRELFPQICTKVDNFLGVQNGEVPTFGYYNLLKPGLMTTPILLGYTLSAVQIANALIHIFTHQNVGISHWLCLGVGAMLFELTGVSHSLVKSNGYNQLFKKITLKRVARTDLIPAAGHEYTHRIQHKNNIFKDKHEIFMEGHARGVEKQLADDYCEREDNEAFLYGISDINVGELKSAYLWMCEKLGQKPREILLKTKTSRDSDESLYRSNNMEPTPHAIGNSLFSIYESLKGRKIYNHMIHGDFQFA